MGGIYISHMRDEAEGVLDSVRETIAIGEKGGLPTQITHHKVIGKKNWGQLGRHAAAGRRGARARRGRDDRSVSVHRVVDEHQRGAAAGVGAGRRPRGDAEARSRIRPTRAKIKAESVAHHPRRARRRRSEERRRSSSCHFDRVARRQEPRRDHARPRPGGRPSRTPPRRRCGSSSRAAASGIFHAIGEEDLAAHPASSGDDDRRRTARSRSSASDVPHPRSYGTFARVLGLYVREKKLLTLEDAVRKMSAFPAQRLGLADRGVLRTGHEGRHRDLRSGARRRHGHVREAATATPKACQPVIVNGQVVFEKGAMTRRGRAGCSMGRRGGTLLTVRLRSRARLHVPLQQSAAAGRRAAVPVIPHRRPPWTAETPGTIGARPGASCRMGPSSEVMESGAIRSMVAR